MPEEGKKDKAQTWSHSRISTFEQCKLKFKFKYVDRIKPKEISTTVEAFLGGQVHLALEKLWTEIQFGRIPKLSEIIDYYTSNWEKDWADDILIVAKGPIEAGRTPSDYRKRGELMIVEHYNRHHPFDKGRVIGLEMKIAVVLPGKEKLIGYIDKLTEVSKGRYEIRDYKTYSKLPDQKILDSDRQLALYALAVRQIFPEARQVELVWEFLAFGRDYSSKRTESELETLAKETSERIKEIVEETDFPPTESALCPYCEFQEICPKRAHLFKLRKLPVEERKREPGSVLVERLAKLREEKRERIQALDSQIGETEEGLISFALENKIDNVSGERHLARIKIEETVSFPGKGEEERDALVKALKKEGVWERVCDLDIFALKRLVKRGEIRSKTLEKFERIETKRSVSLSKLKS